MNTYDPKNWYWIIGGDETQVYASARSSLVPSSDPVYVDWSQNAVATRIGSMKELIEVLLAANVPPYLTVTPRQARLALLAAGLLDKVTAAVNAAGGSTLITWNYATLISRNDPLIATIGTSLNLTSAQIDALFEQAVSL